MNKLLLCLALVLCWNVSSRAAVMGACAVEWLTCEAEVVAVGKLVSVTRVHGSGDILYEDCVLSVSEVVKGTTAKSLTFCYLHYNSELHGWIPPKGDLLVFLAVCKNPRGDEHLSGQLMPVNNHYPLSLFDLSHLPKFVYSKEMVSLTKSEDVLKIVRDWATDKIPYSLETEIPTNSPIFYDLYAGSGCVLIVPAEEKYRAQFMTMAESKQPLERRKAASELYKYPGAETETDFA